MPQKRIVSARTLVLTLLVFGTRALAQDLPKTSEPAAPSAGFPSQSPAGLGAPKAPAPAVEEPPTEAEKTLDAAIAKVKALKSVSADILQVTDMLEQTYELKGSYLKAPGYRVRVELRLSGLPDGTGRSLQVCDGKVLWDFQQVLDAQNFQRTDISKILGRLNAPDVDAKLRDQILTQIGFAGPEALLIGLRKTFRFEQQQEAEFDGVKVWELRGMWKDYQALTPPGQPPLPATTLLPPYIPSYVIVRVGQESGWPYQVDMKGRTPPAAELKVDNRPKGPDGRPIGRPMPPVKVRASSLKLTYSNVQINPELPAVDFAFEAPPNATVVDETDRILTGLDQYLTAMDSQRKAEAAGSGSTSPLEPAPGPPKDAAPAPGVEGTPDPKPSP